MNFFGDIAAILNDIVSVSYYELPRRQISMYLLPKQPTIAIWNNEIQNGRRIAEKVHYLTSHIAFPCKLDISKIYPEKCNFWRLSD